MKPVSLVVVTLLLGGLFAAGCQPAASPGASKEAAITVQKQEGSPSLLTLSEHAAQRLGVTTAEVRQVSGRPLIPYAAIIYDAEGSTWVYTASAARTFQRAPIVVDIIKGDDAILTDGPAAGTAVVTVGAAQLYGAETGVGGGH